MTHPDLIPLGTTPAERKSSARQSLLSAWECAKRARADLGAGGAPVEVLEQCDRMLDELAATAVAVRGWEVERG